MGAQKNSFYVAGGCGFPGNLKNADANQISDYLNAMVIKKEVTVADIMSPSLITCTVETTLAELADLFYLNKLSYIPVVDQEKRQMGEVTIKDLMARGVPEYIKQLGNVRFLKTLEPFEDLLRNEDKIKVGEIMKKSNRGLSQEASIIEAVIVMLNKGYSHIPIMDGEKIVGLVNEADILHKVIRG